MPRQYVMIEFHPNDSRSYMYHNDGPPIANGERVEVDTKHGRQTVTVVGVGYPPPKFETKPIVGRVGEARQSPPPSSDLFGQG